MADAEYFKGEIVKRDITKAAKYLTQSAEAGNQYAQYALGKLYLDKQDREKAHYCRVIKNLSYWESPILFADGGAVDGYPIDIVWLGTCSS